MTDIIQEADRLIESSTSEDVSTYGDETALSERIKEWLETPVGTVADLPGWGHNLKSYKFEPMNLSLEVAIGMAITTKLPQDIDGLIFRGILVEFLEIDLCKIIIRHQFGDTVTELQL